MAKKAIKLTENVLGNIGSARLDEMVRVGLIDGEFEVYVWTDDSGYIPHVHIRDTNSRGENFETCIKLETNEYFLHGHYKDRMNSGMRKAFNSFMLEPCDNMKYQTTTNLQLICGIVTTHQPQ